MGFLFAILGAIPGLLGKFLDYQVQKADKELQGFTTAAGVDLQAYKAYMDGQVEINRIKLAASGWWGAKLIILTAGLPASMHMAAVFLDSFLPPYGSWGIPKIPPPYDTYEWAIVQSFFIIMPVQTGVNAVSQWLNRRR